MRVAWGERGMGMAACVNGTAAGCDIRGHCASRGANGSATQEKGQGSGEEADMATQHPPCTSILLSPPPLTPPLTSHHSRNCFSSKAVSSRKVTSAFTSSIDSVPAAVRNRHQVSTHEALTRCMYTRYSARHAARSTGGGSDAGASGYQYRRPRHRDGRTAFPPPVIIGGGGAVFGMLVKSACPTPPGPHSDRCRPKPRPNPPS
mgnify:CR=1 FL=1